MTGIYKITSPTGKVYIGQSWNIRKRLSAYRNLHQRVSRQVHLFNSIVKYGWNNHRFEIIHELPIDIDQGTMDIYEILYIELYKTCNVQLMNIRGGGSRGKHTEETKSKIRKKRAEQIFSEESLQKRSNSLKGRKRDPELMRYIHQKNTGKPKSEETKKKISEALKKKWNTK